MTLDRGKEALATTALDADPERILEMPEDSYAPFLLTVALAVLFTGMLLVKWLVIVIGIIGCLAGLLLWLWPRRELREREPAPDKLEPARG
jgi:cytochrome c oxidase subunit 1/cytochrome c oxidase subunit I+III